MDQSSYVQDFQIATGTLSVLGAIYAVYRTWVWSKRAGRMAIDFMTLISMIFFLAGALANVFFIIIFGISFYWLIFFKVLLRSHVFIIPLPKVVRDIVVALSVGKQFD